MRPVIITQTGVGQSTPVPLDLYLTPFQVTIFTKVTAPATYGVEYTYDDPFNVPVGGLTWFVATDIPTGTTVNAEGTFDNPIRALRINQAAGAGSVIMTVNQAGAR